MLQRRNLLTFLNTFYKNPVFCYFANSNHTVSHSIQDETAKNPTSSVDADDVRRHGEQAKYWWDPNGPMSPLHSLNDIRVPFIRDGLIATNKTKPELVKTGRVLEGVNILEVGCGGGILTENLARIHANVTAIDPGKEVIQAAKNHLKDFSPDLLERLSYKVETIEDHATQVSAIYDAVVVSEVLEHVTNKIEFLTSCIHTLKPHGSIFITTFNKTYLSWLCGIIFAEKVLRVVPDGIHDWNNFISLLELQRILESLNCRTILVNGYTLNVLTNRWSWIPTLDISFALQAVKNPE